MHAAFRAAVIVGATALGAVPMVLLSTQHKDVNRAANRALTGELVAYEALNGALTLRTNEGDRHFIVQAGTPVQRGVQTITPADLVAATGCRAKVWYRDEEGRWTVYAMRISCSGTVPGP
jgi:hypothetical protein